MVEVRMARQLDDLPRPPDLPRGYSVRWYREGDRETWHRIQESTGVYDPVAPDLFEREFGERADLLHRRQCFIEDGSHMAVGTATAWVSSRASGDTEGRLHWLAVSPDHQRRGIGSHLTLTACLRLRELGATSVYLTTGSQNVGAIQLYLGLGFRPEAGNDADRAAWRSLLHVIEPRFRSQLEEPAG